MNPYNVFELYIDGKFIDSYETAEEARRDAMRTIAAADRDRMPNRPQAYRVDRATWDWTYVAGDLEPFCKERTTVHTWAREDA